jgi:hypothetical protein
LILITSLSVQNEQLYGVFYNYVGHLKVPKIKQTKSGQCANNWISISLCFLHHCKIDACKVQKIQNSEISWAATESLDFIDSRKVLLINKLKLETFQKLETFLIHAETPESIFMIWFHAQTTPILQLKWSALWGFCNNIEQRHLIFEV